eukprot:10050139-Alexandrium_andersonii.AAC.1
MSRARRLPPSAPRAEEISAATIARRRAHAILRGQGGAESAGKPAPVASITVTPTAPGAELGESVAR